MTLCNIKLSDQNDKDKESINKCRRINKAFSTVEYLSNTVVVNDPDLISGLSSNNSPF